MIVRNLIHRPIAVTMCLIALISHGVYLFAKYIPVSLMPDIDIPQITVQVSYPPERRCTRWMPKWWLRCAAS